MSETKLSEELKRLRDELLELQAAARIVVSCWERGNLAGAVNDLGKLLPESQVQAFGSADVDWPWCEDCQSYHHPKNPTCFKLTGQKARVRR